MSVEPVYFGQRDLFGLYRPPSPSVPARRHLVVICNAVFHEYFKIQHAARQLSRELSDNGFDVLRFDFSGQGNSGGDLQTLHWIDDLSQAVDEGRALSGAMQVSLVGFRAGALLAVQSDLEVQSLVLWDPIVDGDDYVEQLQRVHRRLVNSHNYLPDEALQMIGADELLGFQVGEALLTNLKQLRLENGAVNANHRHAVVSTPPADGQEPLTLEGYTVTEEPFVCQWESPSSRLIYAHDVIAKIAEVLT